MVPWLPDEARRLLNETLEVDYRPADRGVLLEEIGRYDGFWGHFDFKVDREVMERGARLKVINTASTGTDHIDKTEAAGRGIRVLSLAADTGLLDSFTATAECAWFLILACMRHFRAANRAASAGDWAGGAQRFEGRQLSGKTLGVLGLGRLGSMTAEYGKAFRMNVLGCERRDIRLPGVRLVDFDTLVRESDVISIHIHLTPENRRLFSREVLARIKPGAVLVNTSRGDLIDEPALLDSLESGRLSAFGADVLCNEWRENMAEQPVVAYAQTHDNLVLTPHLGGATSESVRDARIFSARKLAHFFQTGEELSMIKTPVALPRRQEASS
jgi:D-3-phosphoglycerate dehydrogenase / 2-oxoglutarate reductase